MSPINTLGDDHNRNLDNETLLPHAQPGPSRSEPPSTLPWWAESDYLPPYIQRFIEANVGLCLVCASQLFFVLMNVTVKYFISSTKISIPSLILVRQAMTSIGCIATLYYIQHPYPILGPPEIRRLLTARGILGTGGLITTYQSFRGLSVSDTTAIGFLTPTCLMILGFLVLKERPTRREILSGLLCLGGVMLVSRPPFLFGKLAEDGDVEVPPGRVNLPSHADEVTSRSSRAVGVAYAFGSVFCSSMACQYNPCSILGRANEQIC
jgi:drug/metabolite transporter (DMT)-like permease